jgi:hypothetical protein
MKIQNLVKASSQPRDLTDATRYTRGFRRILRGFIGNSKEGHRNAVTLILLVGPNHPFGGCYVRYPGVIIYSVSVKPTIRRRRKMRKFMLMGALVAVVVAALAIPALAQDGLVRGVDDRELFQEALEEAWDDRLDYWEDQAEEQGREFNEERYESLFDDYFNTLAGFYGFGEDEYWGDEYWGDDYQWDERQWDEGSYGSYYGVGQSFEQEAESGDVNQSFNVSGGGDNSNQCVGIQGVANTGNAQNQVGVIQYGSEAEDFEFEGGSSITVSPSNSTSCDQRVNQAASAFGR